MSVDVAHHNRTSGVEGAAPQFRHGTLADQVSAMIRAHRAGDEEALGELFRAVTPWLHHVALACRLSRHSADDVVQATMESMLRHLPRLRDPDCGLAWLSVIARRESVRISRDERRTDALDDYAGEDTVVDPVDPERLVLAALSREVLMRAMGRLSDRDRNLLQMLFLDAPRDYAAIAAELHMPIGSIGPTRQRGLRKVRDLVVSDRGWDIPRCA